MLDARTITVSIDRDWRAVYEFMAVPENFSRWASGLGALERSGDAWIAHTPDSAMPVRFSARNPHGVVDHWLSPPAGPEIYIPLRIIPNARGSAVMLTVLRRPGVTDEQFAADAAWVARDLKTLKDLMEA